MNGGSNLTSLQLPYGQLHQQFWQHLQVEAEGQPQPLWSISLHRFHDRATYADGDRGETGAQAYEHFVDVDLIDSVGGEVVLDGRVVRHVSDVAWDRLVVISVPSSAAFVALVSHPEVARRQKYKDAAVARSVQLIGRPLDQPTVDAASAPQEDDAVINALFWKFNDPDAPERFLAATPGLARAAGARREAWFDIEGTLVHSGEDWDEVFFGRYPSVEAYDSLNANPTWRRASDELQGNAKNCYDLLVKPRVNRLVESLR